MKKLIATLALLACLPVQAQETKTQNASEIYKQGVIAVNEGNVKAADAAFREVLRLQPSNANARYQLTELQQNQGSIAARAREKKLNEIEIAQIDFSKTELSEALAALSILIEKKADGKFAPNFMIQDPSNKLGEQLVTLQVKNVPAKAAFAMILQQAGAVAKFEEHAIIVKPAARTK